MSLYYYDCPSCSVISATEYRADFCSNTMCALRGVPNPTPLSKPLASWEAPANVYVKHNEYDSWPTNTTSVRHSPMTTAELDRLLRRDSHVTDTSLLMSPKGIVEVGGKEMSNLADRPYTGTKSIPDYTRMIDKYDSIKNHPFSCACIVCTVTPKSYPDPQVSVKSVNKPSYDRLYWEYIHASNEQDAYERLQKLIGAVNLEMVPGDGSWVHTPDPKAMKQVDSRDREIIKMGQKLDFFEAFGKMNWKARFFSVIILMNSLILTIASATGHVH